MNSFVIPADSTTSSDPVDPGKADDTGIATRSEASAKEENILRLEDIHGYL